MAANPKGSLTPTPLNGSPRREAHGLAARSSIKQKEIAVEQPPHQSKAFGRGGPGEKTFLQKDFLPRPSPYLKMV